MRCIHAEGSGCYGHNGADDAAADAALIAMRMPGTPVRVQWMREQENLWEPYSSAMIGEVRANLDAQGRLQDWNYELWTTPHNERIVNAGRLLPARLLARPFTSAPSIPIAQPEGDGDRNAVPLYTLASTRIDMNFVTEMPFRTSAMRSLGAHINIFAIEACMDELANKAGIDPVALRLNHLADPRARAVVERVRDAIGWPHKRNEPGAGIGFAFARYKNIMGYCALAVRLHVHPQTGDIQIDQVVTAVDVGQIVNPDGLRNQVEGGIPNPPVGRCTKKWPMTPGVSAVTTGAVTRSCDFPRCRKSRRAPARSARPTFSGRRRNRAGADGCRDRQCRGECDRTALAELATDPLRPTRLTCPGRLGLLQSHC